MAKNAVGDWDTTASNNSDVGGVNIAENCPAAGINNAIRTMMAQIATLGPIGASTDVTVTATWDLSGATLTLPDDVVTRAKIADAAMSGDDATLITGTAGTSGYVGQWNADGDLIGVTFASYVDAGVVATSDDDGTKSSGTYTPTPVGGNFKDIVNGGAFTLAAPSASGDYSLVIQVTNNASAGAITFSGFSATSNTGALTTTNGDDFFIYITKCNGFTHANVVALQ